MSDLLDTLRERYHHLLLRREEADEAYWADLRAFLADARQAGAAIADPAARDQLRAWMRYLAFLLADGPGDRPDIALPPAEQPAPLPAPVGETRPAAPPPVVWMLAGGVLALLLAVGLVALTRLTTSPAASPPPPTVAPTPTAAPLPFVRRLTVRTADGLTGDTFCQGVESLVAEVEMAHVAPGTLWHWEVAGDAGTVAAQSPFPWGEEATTTFQVLPGGPEGVAPGRYELRLYVAGQLVGVRTFRVLDTGPRLFDVAVSDRPDEDGVEAETRVLYLRYGYVGLCPGLTLVQTLYRGEAALLTEREEWSGPSAGTKQVVFLSPDGRPFPPGDYRAVVEVAGEEQAALEFPLPSAEEVLPSFGDITIALGVQPDGTPLITAPDNRFDWNTKVIYAVFDYVGMQDGTPWSATWTRNGREVAREEHRWDAERDGTAGTYWAAYALPTGNPLPGGDYTVALAIAGVTRQTATFSIRFYVPAQ